MDCLYYIPCCQNFQFQTLKSQTWDTLRQKYVNTKVYDHYYKPLTKVLPKSNEYLSFYIKFATKLLKMAENTILITI